MKNGIGHTISCLLIVALLTVPLMQLLHLHQEDEVRLPAIAKSVLIKASHCSVCDYLAHVKSKENITLNFDLVVLISKLYYIDLFFLPTKLNGEFSIQKSANKSPPPTSLK